MGFAVKSITHNYEKILFKFLTNNSNDVWKLKYPTVEFFPKAKCDALFQYWIVV